WLDVRNGGVAMHGHCQSGGVDRVRGLSRWRGDLRDHRVEQICGSVLGLFRISAPGSSGHFRLPLRARHWIGMNVMDRWPSLSASNLVVDERGAVLVEVTVVMTIMLVFLLGAIEFLFVFYQRNAAAKAVQVGSRIAAVSDPV